MLQIAPAEARLLQEGRRASPMPWVIAIMMFLTVLAAAAGLALGNAAATLDASLQGRLTVQISEASAVIREARVRRAVAELRGLAAVSDVRIVPEEQLTEMLAPWLGEDALEPDLPLPALIDVELRQATPEDVALITQTITDAVPGARVDANAQWLAPLAGLLRSLEWLAIALVLLMAIATSATVVLAARAALNTHRSTIEVMHLLGATDAQVARLFQRRIALDALFGGAAGLGAGLLVLLLLGGRVSDIGSELLGSAGLGWGEWLILLALPLLGALLATLCARVTVMRTLSRAL